MANTLTGPGGDPHSMDSYLCKLHNERELEQLGFFAEYLAINAHYPENLRIRAMLVLSSLHAYPVAGIKLAREATSMLEAWSEEDKAREAYDSLSNLASIMHRIRCADLEAHQAEKEDSQ